MSLTPAQINPTSPALSSFFSNLFGVNTPTFSAICIFLLELSFIFSPATKIPFTTLTKETTPRY